LIDIVVQLVLRHSKTVLPVHAFLVVIRWKRVGSALLIELINLGIKICLALIECCTVVVQLLSVAIQLLVLPVPLGCLREEIVANRVDLRPVLLEWLEDCWFEILVTRIIAEVYCGRVGGAIQNQWTYGVIYAGPGGCMETEAKRMKFAVAMRHWR